MLYFIFGVLAFVVVVILAIGYWLSAPRYKGPVTDHFDGRQFYNPDNMKAKGLREVVQWMLKRERGVWKENNHQDSFGPPAVPSISDRIRITFVNHTTFLIQVNGVNILTDPVWSERVSPFSWIGPRRMRPPGLKFEELPKIDVVLLTHNHYDHLDIGTVKRLYAVHQPRFITPLGVGAYLTDNKVGNVTDIDWWNVLTLQNNLRIQSVPAQHFSGRGFRDRDATLWCGYVLTTAHGKIYFAGDTGYHPETFKTIGNQCGPFRLSLLPIGAYKPAWFMSPIHCSPEEAVLIHRDVNAQQSIATHFGTFPLADDSQHDPLEDLKHALVCNHLDPQSFLILQEGEPYDFY